jgi:tubulin-specific chaperone A
MNCNKKLKIQNSIMKRMIKEVEHYKKELLTNEELLNKMEREDRDKYDIKKQNELLEESKIMVTYSSKLLDKEKDKLEALLNDISEDPNLDYELINESENIFNQL